MKLKSKIIAGVFGAVALAAVPVSIALTATSCGSGSSTSNGTTNDGSGSNGSGSGSNKPGSNGNNNGHGPQVGSGGADIVGLKKPIPGVIENPNWKIGDTFVLNGFTYKVIKNPNYFVPEYGFPVAQPENALEVISADSGVISPNKIATNNSTGVVDYYDNSGKGHIALPVTKIAANLLASAVIGSATTPQEIVIPDSVSEIGGNAFNGILNNISRIVLGNSLRVIGANAFSNLKCTSGIAFPQVTTTIGFSAFENTDFTGELVIPPKVTRISQNAFSGCTGLTGVKFPNGLKTIGSGAFQGCISLTGRLYIPESVTSIENSAFFNDTGYDAQSVYVSEACMNALDEKTQTKNLIFKPISQRPADQQPPANAFTPPYVEPGQDIQPQQPIPGLVLNDNWKLGDIFEKNGYTYEIVNNPSYAIPQYNQIMAQPKYGVRIDSGIPGVVKLNNMADNNDTGIVNYSADRTKGEVALPVVEIADGAFNNTFTDPNGMGSGVTIGDGSAIDIIIPNTVVSIGDVAFANIKNQVNNFKLSSNLRTIGITTFASLKYSGSLILPSTLESMGARAFTQSSITGQLVIPPKIKFIPYDCFYSCGINALSLPDGLQQIGIEAFCANNSLSGTLVIPDSVRLIDNKAFYGNRYAPQTVFINSKCVIQGQQNPNIVFQKKA